MSLTRKLVKASPAFAVAILIALPTTARAALSLAPVGDAHNIFVQSNGIDYRYGPSFIRNGDGSIDMWTCSTGGGGAWDFIRHSRSTDDGATFGDEQIVLRPNTEPGSEDLYSACDPSVVKFGGFYYLAYTSTKHADGSNNNVFVARATSPTGPFEKWNGSGWGASVDAPLGSPKPFITYEGDDGWYGDGEPSLVVKGTTLYIYYSEYTSTSNTTKVAIASTTDSDWPAHVTKKGTAITREGVLYTDGLDIQDSTNHEYIESLDKFIAVGTVHRFDSDFYVQVYESKDGLTYTPASQLTQNLVPYGHNMGISGGKRGHLDPSVHNFIAYAYGSTWGQWNTVLQPFNLTDLSTAAEPDQDNSGRRVDTESGIKGAVRQLQPFSTSGTTLSRLDVWLYKQGTPANPLTLKIYALDGSGAPTGLPLYTTKIRQSALSGTPTRVTVEPNLSNLDPGGAYGYVLSSPAATDGGTADSYGWAVTRGHATPPEYRRSSNDGGTSWQVAKNENMAFVTYASAVVDQDDSAATFSQWHDIYANVQRLQTFTVSSTTLPEVDIWTETGPPPFDGDLVVRIFAADGSNHPTGSALYTASLNPVMLPATFGWLRVYPNLSGLTPGGRYAFVLSSPRTTRLGNAYGWAYNDNDPYAGGAEAYSANGGASWITEPRRDLKFIAYR